MNEADEETARLLRGANSSEADRQHARAGGEEAGADLTRQAGENPYGHDVFGLRTAWFEGFSIGRARAAQGRGEDY